MKYQIIAEGHEGVYSVDEEILTIIEAYSKESAILKFFEQNNKVQYCENWNCWLIGARKIWAQEIL